jgi:outer membrane lipase/esterase
MRHSRSRAWARSAISAATLALGAAGLSLGATAQEKYQRLFVFGDSYADMTLSDQPAKNPLAQPNPFVVPPFGTLPPGVGLSLWRVYPVPLAADLGIARSQIQDIAVGGATASPTAGSPDAIIVPAPIAPGNLPQQVDGFLATNPSFAFGPRDLVTINIGGNDIRSILGNTAAQNLADGYPELVINKDNAKDFGARTAEYVLGGIDRKIDGKGGIDGLVGAGARTFALGVFSSISGLPELQDGIQAAVAKIRLVNPGLTDEQAAQIAADIAKSADNYSDAYFKSLQAGLQPFAQSGTRFFMLDLARLGQQALQDSRYGFTVTGTDAQNNPQSKCPVTVSTTTCGGSITSDEQKKYYFGPDGLHLTTAGFQLVADYMANQVMAPDTIAVQPGIVMTTTSGFVSSLFGRLDATRDARTIAGVGGWGADGPMGLGATEKSRAPQPTQSGRFTSYAMGTFLGGSRSDSPDLVGFDYDAKSGTAGIEYSVNRNLIFGLAANYTNTSADTSPDLNNNRANIDIDAIQGAAYLSYATRQMFGEVLAAYGSHDIGLVRPGAVDFKPISSSTDANAYSVAARGGYLFDFGSLRAGPIAGLTYIHTRVDGYTEKGDDLVTFNVSAQTLDSLTGNLGIRFLAPFKAADGSVVVPYLNVMLEHQFGDHERTLTASLEQAPLLPILTSFPNFDTRTYGRVEGGVTLQLTPDLSASITGASTFARDDGQDHRVSAGLNYRF